MLHGKPYKVGVQEDCPTELEPDRRAGVKRGVGSSGEPGERDVWKEEKGEASVLVAVGREGAG